MNDDGDRPEGVHAVGLNGELHPLDDIEQLPDEGCRHVWLVRVPRGLSLAVPLEVQVAKLPGNTEIRFEWALR